MKIVATVLTACGIETSPPPNLVVSFNGMVATVLTACGIETPLRNNSNWPQIFVATVLTACGIETWDLSITFPYSSLSCNSAYRLRYWNSAPMSWYSHLGIRLRCNSAYRLRYWNLVDDKTRGRYRIAVATVLTACGIKTTPSRNHLWGSYACCNSAYRLRYWNCVKQNTSFTMSICCNSAYRLRYWNVASAASFIPRNVLQQCLPLAVLKLR